MQNTIAMVHKECKPKNLRESYRPLILTSCIGKRLEKSSHRQPEQLGRNLRKKSDRQQNSFKKKRSTNDNLFKLFETIKIWFSQSVILP